MSGEGKIPEQEFEFSKWTSEQAVETLERADGPLKAPGALGVDPATVKAGAAVVLDVLNKLLAALGEIDRKVAIAISNYLAAALKSPKVACWSGDVSDTSPRIGGGEAGFFSAQMKWGVYGTQDRVAVMWSVPKGVGYKNWFKMSIIPAKTPTDVALFDDM